MYGLKTFVVIGLGRFGTAVATELSSLGHAVLALDDSEENVQKVADKVTHAVTGDARDPAVLRALGVRNYDCAIVAVGDDVGNSALITLNLKEIGVKRVICKAQSHVHRKHQLLLPDNAFYNNALCDIVLFFHHKYPYLLHLKNTGNYEGQFLYLTLRLIYCL